jgi:hypothetical protein
LASAIADGAAVTMPLGSVVSGNGSYGFVLVGDSTDQFVAASGEAPDGPALVVTYTTGP